MRKRQMRFPIYHTGFGGSSRLASISRELKQDAGFEPELGSPTTGPTTNRTPVVERQKDEDIAQSRVLFYIAHNMGSFIGVDHYSNLGLKPHATKDEIREAYHRLSFAVSTRQESRRRRCVRGVSERT